MAPAAPSAAAKRRAVHVARIVRILCRLGLRGLATDGLGARHARLNPAQALAIFHSLSSDSSMPNGLSWASAEKTCIAAVR